MFLDDNECRLSNQSSNAITYTCSPINRGYYTGQSIQGRSVQFFYSGNSPLNICEIEIFKNPSTLLKLNI